MCESRCRFIPEKIEESRAGLINTGDLLFLFVSGHNGLEVDHSRPRGLVVESLRALQPRRIVLELDWCVLLPFKMTPLLKLQVASNPLRFRLASP